MLRAIRIRNLAVIEAVDVDFSPGFTALTGETGAGKSIVADAVDVLLGGRASADLVRTGQPQASIEARFDLDGRPVVIRREVAAQGRSRAFVDGTPVTAAQLRERAGRLVDLHGQHEQQRLFDPQTHLDVLDDYAGIDRTAIAASWAELARAREAFRQASMDAKERAARLEWLSFQLSELDSVQPRPGEDDELQASKARLMHAERLQRLAREGYDLLVDQDGSAQALLAAVGKRVDELAQIDASFERFVAERPALTDYIADLGRTLVTAGESVEDAAERLAQVEDRLALLDRVKRRHGPSLDAVLAWWVGARVELENLQHQRDPHALEAAVAGAEEAFLAVARGLSTARRAAATRFSRELQDRLATLAMEHTRFEVRFGTELEPDRWSARGVDDAEFFVSANLGEDTRPLARVASGGELSRLMLALHLVTLGRQRESASGRTLIFDEVDAGIGGRVADAVGECLQMLGRQFQVLCITHLPAIAARATTQFVVEKETRGGRTRTLVTRLDDEGRVDEVARMLAGGQRTEAVQRAARDLLSGVGLDGGERREVGERRKRKS